MQVGVGITGGLQMRRHFFRRQGAAARREGGVGLDQLLVEGAEGGLIGAQIGRCHRGLRQKHRCDRPKSVHCAPVMIRRARKIRAPSLASAALIIPKFRHSKTPDFATLGAQAASLGSRGDDKRELPMQTHQARHFVTAIAASALSLGGCATKDYVNEHVAAVDAKVQATQSQVDQHQTHLSQLDQTTKEALDRATAAGKLAEGKFLYSMVLSDDSVKFPVDSAKLSPEAQERLTDFADKLKDDNRNVYLEIQGHTDARGPDTINERLGEERAEAVRLFMNQHGVPLNRMSTISYGKQDPVADNKTRTGRAQNRRVVMVVMS